MPQTEIKQQFNSTDYNCTDILRYFHWFDSELLTKIKEASDEFWNTNLNISLFSISKKPGHFWKDDDYFATQISIFSGINCTLRLSEVALNLLIEETFGETNQKKSSKLNAISELEAKIITAYNGFVYKNLQDFFIDKKILARAGNLNELSNDFYHFVFFIHSKEMSNHDAGKLIISIPKNILISPILLPLPDERLCIKQFESSKTIVDIFVGSTKISLDDIKNLEREDIIILDNSNIYKLRIISNFSIEVKVNPNPKLVLNLNDDDGGDAEVNEEINSSTDMWDNLQIEVNADFKKIKISLGELRQISEGLIVDLASVYDNEVTLSVEKKPVAAGELVIIGDRYGIKLTKIFADKEQPIENEGIPAPDYVQDTEINDTGKSIDNNSNDEDFDYDDFEIEDDI